MVTSLESGEELLDYIDEINLSLAENGNINVIRRIKLSLYK